MLTLNTFGGLSLTGATHALGGAAVQRRPLAVLAVLAVAAERGVSRERLQALLWPESDTERARKVLAQTIYAIRRDLGNPNVVLGTTELRLDLSVISADVTELEQAIGTEKWERAAALYVGPFLDGVHLSDAPEFERWVETERSRLATQAHAVLTRLAQASESAGDWEVAAGWWRRLAALDPHNGRVATRLISALAAAGDTAGALRHARVHEMMLREEFDAPPDPAVTALVNRLRTQGQSGPPVKSAEPARVASAPTVKPRAPVQESPPPAGAPRADPPSGLPTVAAAQRQAPSHRLRRWWPLAGAVLLAVIVAPAALLKEQRDASAVDVNQIVVVPFDVADPELWLWREGLVDIFARNLDGAGPLRTISPTRVVREWTGHADRETVREYARQKGAGMALYGQLVRAGVDSVRATVTLLDVADGRPVVELRRRDAVARIGRLTDSLTVDVLRAIGGVVPLGAARAAPLGGTSSIEALRAFLLGEQFYRRTAWDSAVGHYLRAVAIDSSFALAWRRLGLVASWRQQQDDSLTQEYLLHAGAANRGLGRRDSLLVAADSLSAGTNRTPGEAATYRLSRRLFATLDTAARLYPDDPEVWFAIGEARYHIGTGPGVGVPERATLEAFDRAIALDSAFAPAYIHSVELGLNIGGAPLGLRHARAYLSRNPTEAAHPGILIAVALIEARGADDPATRRLLDTVETSALVSARTILRRWPDPAETAIRVSRLLAAGRPSDYARFADTAFMRRRLAQELAFRGHLTESVHVLGMRRDSPIFAELAWLGVVPADTAQAVFTRWTRTSVSLTQLALPWWAERRDTASLGMVVRELQARADSGDRDAENVARLSYASASAAAYLALARGDTAAALPRFIALPDTLCYQCYLDRLTRARLLAAAGKQRESLTDLAEPLVAFATPIEVVFAIERARVTAGTGPRSTRDDACAFARAAWLHGDPDAKRRVAEVCK